MKKTIKKIVIFFLASYFLLFVIPYQTVNAQTTVSPELEIDVREFFRQVENEIRFRELERQLHEMARQAAENPTQYNINRYAAARNIHGRYTQLVPTNQMERINPNQWIRNGSALAVAGYAMEIIDWSMAWNIAFSQYAASGGAAYNLQTQRIPGIIRTEALDNWANESVAGHFVMRTIPEMIEMGNIITESGGFFDMTALGWQTIGNSLSGLFSSGQVVEGTLLNLPELPKLDIAMLRGAEVLIQNAQRTTLRLPMGTNFNITSMPATVSGFGTLPNNPNQGTVAGMPVTYSFTVETRNGIPHTRINITMPCGSVRQSGVVIDMSTVVVTFWNEMRTIEEGSWQQGYPFAGQQFDSQIDVITNNNINERQNIPFNNPPFLRHENGLPVQQVNASPFRDDFLSEFWPNWDSELRVNFPEFGVLPDGSRPNPATDTRTEQDKILDWLQNVSVPQQWWPPPRPEHPNPQPEISTDRHRQTQTPSPNPRCETCNREKIRDEDEILKCPICDFVDLPQPCPKCPPEFGQCTDPDCPHHPDHPENPNRPRPPPPPPPRPPAITFAMFPFCIPWDVFRIVDALAATPVKPVLEAQPFAPMGVDWTWQLDFAMFDPVINVFRWAMRVGFVIGLALMTRKFIWTGGG